MLRTPEQAAELMEQRYPRVAESLGGLVLADVRMNLVGSRPAEHAALCLGTAAPRADDWDILIHPEDFERAVDLLHAEVERDISIRVPTGDGLHMRMRGHNALARIDDHTIQFLYPLTPVNVGGNWFDTRLTDEAFATSRRLGSFVIGDYIDIAMLYALRQGKPEMGKHDLERAALARTQRDPSTASYAELRVRQIGWDGRMWEFDSQAARRAAELLSTALVPELLSTTPTGPVIPRQRSGSRPARQSNLARAA